MRCKYLCAGLAVAVLAITAVVWTFSRSSANHVEARDDQGGPTASALPIAQVILFNSGVGYFERQGEVVGDSKVELSFPTSDVNDLLKSMVLSDTAGGRVHAVSYDSQDPIEKILRSFALDLNSNPTFGQILNQARGEKIEVMRQETTGGNPRKISGTIIGMESHRQVIKDTAVDVEQLNLLTSDGMLGIPLSQVLSVRFQDQRLESEFQRALHVLAGSHDVQKKTVALQFNGNGKRGVKVGYVVERPIWKTTYRLVMEPNGKLHMQGWAIVENTSDDDWKDVRMVLVSGRPISFRMDLYEPLYIPRPFVEPDLFASLRPPVYGGSMMQSEGRPDPAGFNFYTGVLPGGDKGKAAGGAAGFVPMPGQPVPTVSSDLGSAKKKDKGDIGGRDQLTNQFQSQIREQDGNMTQNKLAYDEMMRRKLIQNQALGEGKKVGSTIAGLNYKEGIQSIASSEEVGDYYQYIIDQKISLARQKSAMLPILNQTIAGGKVSIYNEAVLAKYPLLGIRLKNTSGKPLTQGPITVYDDGSYAGDTRTLDLQPNEERLLSYAIDQGTEIKSEIKTYPAPDMTLKIGGNNLTARYTLRQIKSYAIKNRSTHDRTVIIEHPIRGDWNLVEPKKPNDRSRDVYRFEAVVKAGELVKYDVMEEQSRVDPHALVKGQDSKPLYAIASGIEIRPDVVTTPRKLLSLSITKGVLAATYKDRESKTYFVQNLSDRDHNFTIDHVILEGWKRLDAKGKDQKGPDVFSFKLEVPSAKSAHQEVVEERVYTDFTMVVANLDDSSLRKFIAHEAPSETVKAALQQVADKQTALKQAKQGLAEKKEELKILSEDQARVRENLRIIPQNSQHYNDFLKKFVAQETQIEELQREVRVLDAALQKTQKEYETFVSTLTAK